MTKVSSVMRAIGSSLRENSPLILTGFAVAGLVSTTVLAVRATVKATPIADDILSVGGTGKTRREEYLEVLQATWPLYIPAAVTGTVTIACIIGANTISSKRQAALIGAYSITEAAFREYKDKVVEQIGKNQEQKVRDGIAQDRVNNDPMREVIITGNGDVLCYDTYTGRYFQCNIETLRKAQNDINLQCIHEMNASQNEFYRKIGLPAVSNGDEVGWNTDNVLDLRFSTVLTEDGKPCLVISYAKNPEPKYYKIW